jgi:hypothetical protein
MSIEKINKYVGIKWKKLGSSFTEGVDCWGFLRLFYSKEFNLDIPGDYHTLLNPDSIDFSRREKVEMIRSFEEGKKSSVWERIDSPEDNCAVAMSCGTKIHHVGVWLNGGCLHAVEGMGVIFNDIKRLKQNWYSKLEFYRCNLL